MAACLVDELHVHINSELSYLLGDYSHLGEIITRLLKV